MNLSCREAVLALLGSAALSLFGCAGTAPPGAAGAWHLDHVEGADGSSLPTPSGFELAFSANGDATASDGCNSCRGHWVASAESAERGSVTLACTMMFCAEHEDAQRLLGSLRTWEMDRDRVLLPAGDARVILRRAESGDAPN